MRSRRDFFSVLGGFALVSTVGGCIDFNVGSDVDSDVGPEGAVEIRSRTANLWYGNTMPGYAPAVRQSPALAQNVSVMKH